jgi:hypothetical protein
VGLFPFAPPARRLETTKVIGISWRLTFRATQRHSSPMAFVPIVRSSSIQITLQRGHRERGIGRQGRKVQVRRERALIRAQRKKPDLSGKSNDLASVSTHRLGNRRHCTAGLCLRSDRHGSDVVCLRSLAGFEDLRNWTTSALQESLLVPVTQATSRWRWKAKRILILLCPRESRRS